MASHGEPPAVTRTLSLVAGTTLSVLLTLSGVLATATVAHAQPSPAEMERRLDVEWNKLEPVIERHNAIREDLKARQGQAAALQGKIRPLQAQVDQAMRRVGQFAAQSYKGANASAFNALLSSGSPTAFADRLTLLDQFAKEQQARVRDVVSLKARYDAQKQPLDALVAHLVKTEKALSIQKQQIDAEIKRLQTMRLAAYGTSGPTGTLRPAACPYVYNGGAGGTAATFACAQIGKPYRYAADGPESYDCSGLTQASWARAGVGLPHNARQQSYVTQSVTRSQLRPGDLIFYYSDIHHVAIYVGGEWVVHAPRTGDQVRMRKLDIGQIYSYGRPG